jgi:histidinol-phosphate/aromatic aminotransferase/cobyric acid decarboxylase-like protein
LHTGPYYHGDVSLQYKEYERAAQANDRRLLTHSAADRGEKEARIATTYIRVIKQLQAISALVNPSNPSGDYMPLAALKEYIATNAADKSFVLVDESMLPWYANCSHFLCEYWCDHSVGTVHSG